MAFKRDETNFVDRINDTNLRVSEELRPPKPFISELRYMNIVSSNLFVMVTAKPM